MIPRDDGGRRPIGAPPVNIRVFGWLARIEAKRWETAQPRSHLLDSKGRSRERATWEQSTRTEHARTCRHKSAHARVDMSKCYEKAPSPPVGASRGETWPSSAPT
eukprot:4743630-Pyramimonas_sp.AAC.1